MQRRAEKDRRDADDGKDLRDMLKEADAGGRWEGEGRAVGGGHASPSAPP